MAAIDLVEDRSQNETMTQQEVALKAKAKKKSTRVHQNGNPSSGAALTEGRMQRDRPNRGSDDIPQLTWRLRRIKRRLLLEYAQESHGRKFDRAQADYKNPCIAMVVNYNHSSNASTAGQEDGAF